MKNRLERIIDIIEEYISLILDSLIGVAISNSSSCVYILVTGALIKTQLPHLKLIFLIILRFTTLRLEPLSTRLKLLFVGTRRNHSQLDSFIC